MPGMTRLVAPAAARALVLGLALCVGPAGAGPRPLRVVTDSHYPPYVSVDAQGQPAGYLVDLWRLWERKTGTPVVLQPMRWAAAQQTMREGRADVIDMLFRTPEREALYTFSRPYANVPASIYADVSIGGIPDARALSGLVVGVQRGDACMERLAGMGVSSVHAYADYAAMLDAAKAGQVKVFCMDDMPADHHLYEQRLHQRYRKAFTLYTGQFHRAVRKGDMATVDLVERGMAGITQEERAGLRRKWFAEPLPAMPSMRLLAVGMAGVLATLALGFLWIRALRRAVLRQTADIRRKNAQLEQAAHALVADQAQLRSVLEGSPEAMALKDTARVYVHCNRAFEELVGLARDRILGRTDDDLFDDKAFVALVASEDADVLCSARTFRSDEVLVAIDGRERCLEVVKVPVRGPDGTVTGVLAVSRDMTGRRRAERELRIASVAFESQDAMLIADAGGTIERVNAAFTRMTGFAPEEAVGRDPRFLVAGLHEPGLRDRILDDLRRTGYWKGDIVNRHRSGHLYTVRMAITAVADGHGGVMRYVGHFQDISAEQEARALAEHLKLFDPLTELPNRMLLAQRVAAAVGDCASHDEFGAVMMIDLDHFRKVNDSLGHAAGDRLLVEMAARIRSVKRDTDTLARFSAGSFAMLCERLGADRDGATAQALRLAEAARLAMADQVVLDGQRFACSGSVGVTLFHEGATGCGSLLRQAELAMYKSKEGGRNRSCFFEEGMQSEVDDRNWLEGELREAIAREQLALFYQVQVDREGRPIGAEALVRWHHPVRGTISPAAFIPLAEETGLIVEIGRWVIASACRQLARWSGDAALGGLTLAVNISPLQFKAPGFVDEILAEVRRSGASSDRLKLEVTESLAIDDFKTSISRLNALKAHGFRIALDDFGTGNSSLNYLTKLPLAQLKIDKSFVDELPASHRDAMVAQTIIAMGQGLGLDVIAEGVETGAQRDFLAAHGCHAFQGYLFGKPVPAAEFEAMAGAAIAAGSR
jgi:diguanylate cyclase (GGDEF)-like protein/PAS domain S-box-containing protein